MPSIGETIGISAIDHRPDAALACQIDVQSTLFTTSRRTSKTWTGSRPRC